MARRTLESLGRLVRDKRAEQSLRECASIIGISAPTLMRIESGRVPDVATFGKVCTWLEIDPAEFIGKSAAVQPRQQVDRETEVSIHLKADKFPDKGTLAALSEMIAVVARRQAPSDMRTEMK